MIIWPDVAVRILLNSYFANILMRHKLIANTVRAVPVKAQEPAHMSTSSMRTDSWLNIAGSIASAFAIGTLIVAPYAAKADNFTQGFNSAIGLEYDTNPLLSSTNEKSIWRTIISPRYKLSTQTGVDDWAIDAGLDIQKSTDVSVLIDRVDPNLNLQWTRSLETGQFGLKAHYDKASTRVTELEDTGVVTKDANKNTKLISANWLYNPAEKYSLSTNAEYSTVEYDAGNLSNYQNRKLSANLSRLNSDTLKTYVQVAYSHFKLDTGTEPTTQINAIVGFNLETTERIVLGANIGLNQLSGATSGSGTSGGADIAYLTDNARLSLDISRSSTPSGAGGFIESDKLKTAWSYDLSDKYKTGLDYTWSQNRSLNNTELRQAGAWLNHELSDFWSVRFSVLNKTSIRGTTEAMANVLGVTFQYNHPDF